MADGNLVASIDGLLKKRGSPLAGMGNVFVASAKKYGVDPRLVVSISGIESGFGQHIPTGTFNAWGWGPGHPFASWQEGISTVTRGIKDGYYSRGLRTPQQIVTRYAPGSAGNDEQNWASAVSQFMHELGGAVPIKSTKVGGSAALATPAARSPLSALAVPSLKPSSAGLEAALMSNLSSIALHGGKADPFSMLSSTLGGLQQDRATDDAARALRDAQAKLAPKTPSATSPTPSPTRVPSVRRTAAAHSGAWLTQGVKPIGTPFVGTHTIGNWQSDNALDIPVPTGTPIYAPTSGKLGNTGLLPGAGPSGGGRFAGERINLYGGGQGFYFAHLSKLAPGIRQGATVRKGQLLGYTGSANGIEHLHFGVEYGSPYDYYG